MIAFLTRHADLLSNVTSHARSFNKNNCKLIILPMLKTVRFMHTVRKM